ncbi:YtxH domain-containing protein [Candidatus Saccharibacteria bacterium]|nr:YtxH domain-containing protein [Candidatus Saccharibacteria bacterium]
MSESKGNGKFFLGAVCGAIAGAIAGVVLAPKSGKETREDIKAASDKAIKGAKETGHKFFKHDKEDDKAEKVAKKAKKAKDEDEE